MNALGVIRVGRRFREARDSAREEDSPSCHSCPGAVLNDPTLCSVRKPR
jgi:hypothetical protein